MGFGLLRWAWVICPKREEKKGNSGARDDGGASPDFHECVHRGVALFLYVAQGFSTKERILLSSGWFLPIFRPRQFVVAGGMGEGCLE